VYEKRAKHFLHRLLPSATVTLIETAIKVRNDIFVDTFKLLS